MGDVNGHNSGVGGGCFMLMRFSYGFFFFKQKTAYEITVRDWSSDVCSSDLRAAERLAPWAHRTPVLTSRSLDGRCGGSVVLKCENLQRVGAFKFRGAMNAVLQLSDAERAAGVVTHSSGNHAQALALAGQLTGTPICVVMPRTAPAIKRAATE